MSQHDEHDEHDEHDGERTEEDYAAEAARVENFALEHGLHPPLTVERMLASDRMIGEPDA